MQRLVIEAFSYWVREFDIDGFRVDVAWGPRQRAPEAGYRQASIVGKVSGASSWSASRPVSVTRYWSSRS